MGSSPVKCLVFPHGHPTVRLTHVLYRKNLCLRRLFLPQTNLIYDDRMTI